MKTGIIRLTLLCLVSGACSSIIAPDADGALLTNTSQVSLDFTSRLIRPGPEPIPEFRAEAGVRRIVVVGAIGTPVPCYDLQGNAAYDDRTITLEVTALPREVSCITVVATFAYEAAIRELAPGRYLLRVVHSRDGASQTVFEQEVEVS